ncbi:hypothetical protein GC169_07055 [bacterium]|nr:hypothetical protein [bacterium]
MHVSWRHIAIGAVAILGGGAAAVGQPPGACCAPPARVAPPPHPPAPSMGCCTRPSQPIVSVPGVNVAGPNITVGPTTSNIHLGSVNTTLSSGIVIAGASASASSIVVIGGGGSFAGASAPAPAMINGLNVAGGTEIRTVVEDTPVEESYCEDKVVEERMTRPVQAVCIDDAGAPHPASRVDGDLSVATGYRGEVFRCVAGTSMQVTLGRMEEGRASFAAGETFSCGKGEALVHGAGGKLACAPQMAERNCNERSLLRKFGPGVKLVEVRGTKTICEPATRTRMTRVEKTIMVEAAPTVGNLALDGGVGQSVW